MGGGTIIRYLKSSQQCKLEVLQTKSKNFWEAKEVKKSWLFTCSTVVDQSEDFLLKALRAGPGA